MENKKRKILIVEDDEIDQMAFERFANEENLPFSYIIAESVKEAKKFLEEEKFDAVLLDYRLGDGTAFDLFDKVETFPFIIVTGTGDEEIAVKAMKSGAYDYLIKDTEGNYLKTLSVTVENAIKRKRAEEELIKYREHLEELVKERTTKLQAEIAERKKAEEALQEAHDKLENRVEERTSELKITNKQLQQEITERKRAEEQIKASLKEKEVLLKEIHHRVKNNMQIVSSLLNLQSRHIKDKQALEMFRESQNRVRSMALVHEKLYGSKDLARIDFAGYIKSLAQSLYQSYETDPGRVALKVKVEGSFLDVNIAVPCGLIINELVSNALKHAFPPSWEGKGKIEISLHPTDDNEIELIVSDNGIGFSKDLDIRGTESLGLLLIFILVEDQLKGKIKLDRRKGTKYKIKFKRLEV